MRILKFEGATMRDAIAKVKAELGDQAVIISTRQVRRGLLGSGIEISAAIDDDHAHPVHPPLGSPPLTASTPDVTKLIDPLRSELRSLRAQVRTAGDARGNAELRAELAALRKLVEELAPRLENPPPASKQTIPPRGDVDPVSGANVSIDTRGERNGHLVAPSTARAIILVGPTGAGKTTTIAKLAARAALIEHRRVKLVTLDNFRIGGVDQIRTYADLIGVPLEVLDHPDELARALDDDYELTLIDTAGRSPRDPGPLDELATAVRTSSLETHLVAPAATTLDALDQLARRYRALAPARLLVTKLDEVEQATDLARMSARSGLPITWITTGQAVPEDLEEPTAARVLDLATRRHHRSYHAA